MSEVSVADIAVYQSKIVEDLRKMALSEAAIRALILNPNPQQVQSAFFDSIHFFMERFKECYILKWKGEMSAVVELHTIPPKHLMRVEKPDVPAYWRIHLGHAYWTEKNEIDVPDNQIILLTK